MDPGGDRERKSRGRESEGDREQGRHRDEVSRRTRLQHVPIRVGSTSSLRRRDHSTSRMRVGIRRGPPKTYVYINHGCDLDDLRGWVSGRRLCLKRLRSICERDPADGQEEEDDCSKALGREVPGGSRSSSL